MTPAPLETQPLEASGTGAGVGAVVTFVQPRRLRADAARNRQALIDAAERLFTARGLSVTLDDIAAEAGVNVATAYRHFANKHALIGAFLQQQIEEAVTIAQDAAATPDPWQGITQFLTRTLELLSARRGLVDVFKPGFADEWLERLDAQTEPLLLELIERGRAAGVLREDLAPGDLGVILHMLATVCDIPAADQKVLMYRYLELMLAALRPTGTSLPGTAPTPAEARTAIETAARARSNAATRRATKSRPIR